MNFSIRFRIAILLAVCLVTSGARAASVPPTVGYQGRLYDAANQPVNTSLAVVFALYQAASGGTPVWTETQNVTFSNGYFSVQLGSTKPFNVTAFDGTLRFLGVTVGNDPEMTPRAAIASVPYALTAANAITAATAAYATTAAPDARFGAGVGINVAAGTGRQCTLGEIILTASLIANGTPAAGQLLAINSNGALFLLLGTLYGGDGQTTFGLPDLRAAAPNGLTYSICTAGIFPARD